MVHIPQEERITKEDTGHKEKNGQGSDSGSVELGIDRVEVVMSGHRESNVGWRRRPESTTEPCPMHDALDAARDPYPACKWIGWTDGNIDARS